MIEDCQEMLDQMTAQLQEQQRELTCIDQASQLIETLAGEIHEHFGGRLWEASARLMQELTGQDRSFKVQPDLKILVDNSRTLIPLERLSRAAMEQFYLAVRLGAASLLFGDEAMPLVLDDTFAYYDDERLKRSFPGWRSAGRGSCFYFAVSTGRDTAGSYEYRL